MAVERTPELDRVALQSETLYAVIGVVASSPDLDRVLDGVVDLLTAATDCHACFVYLRDGDRLRLRAASQVYAHLVGRVEMGLDGARYEPILPSGEHHHHIVCDDCGRIEAFEDTGLERAIGKLERRTGFTIEGHEVVLHGACSLCAPARSS